MPVQKKKLKVLPNPWTYIDHQGRAVGHVKVEQPAGGFDPRSVGARIADDPVLISKAQSGVPLAQDVHEIEFEYSTEAVEVPNTDYYRRCVMSGDLIAADRESFISAGGRPKDFEGYKEHIEAKKTAAIKQFDLENGDGAFEELRQQREEAAALRAKVARSAAGDEEPAAPAATPKTSKPVKPAEGGAQ